MRRRQKYAAINRLDTPRVVEPLSVAPAELPKGACPKCHKIIGRGLYFHVKACNGDIS